MTDEKFVMLEDIRREKQIAHSASKRKGGSKSKRCSLPSDFMTKKEKEQMNGPVTTWNMNEWYTYDEFKAMPNDLKVEYINRIIANYNVGLRTISREVFGKSDTALRTSLKKCGLLKDIKLAMKVGGGGARALRAAEALRKAMGKSVNIKADETEKPADPKPDTMVNLDEPKKPKHEDDAPKPKPVEKPAKKCCDWIGIELGVGYSKQFSLSFSGSFDANDILDIVMKITKGVE